MVIVFAVRLENVYLILPENKFSPNSFAITLGQFDPQDCATVWSL